MSIYRAVVTISAASLGGTGTNTWHIRQDGNFLDPIDATVLMDIIKDFYDDTKVYYPLDTLFRFNGELPGVGADTGQQLDIPPWTITGLGNGGSLPPMCSICVSWSGEQGDRSKDGRTFFGPLTPSALETNGSLNNGCLQAFRDAAVSLIDSSDTVGNGAIGVWSRQELVLRDFVSSHVSDQFASLKSRRD